MPSPKRARVRRAWIPWALLAVLALASVLAANYVAESARDRDQLRFEAAAEQAHEAIRERIEASIGLLRATSGLFGAVPEVDRRLFAAYVDRVELPRRYRGMQAIGFSRRAREGGRHAVVSVEPRHAASAASLGSDLSADPVLAQAMESARDTGLAEGSGKVGDGFYVFVPVYAGGRVPEAVPERRAALEGFVYAPFRAGDLMWGVFGGETPRNIQVEVYDGAEVREAREESLLYRSAPPPPEAVHAARTPIPLREFASHTTLDMAGRVWTLQFRSGPGFPRDNAWSFVPVVLLAGLASALVLFAVTRAQVRAHAQAEELAGENAKLYRRAEAARAEAEVANRAKDEFLATLSHELRTPLTAILGWTRILRKEEVDDATAARGLEVIERNVRAQSRLIEDVLDVSRIITGKMQLSVRRVELGAVIEAATESVRPAAAARGIELAAFLEERCTIAGDPERLQQVLWNLISNAIKFTPQGGRIEVRLLPCGETVSIEVTDSGKGIDPEFLPYVFDRFRQADSSSTRAHGGLGIGLALVRHLVELHGGTVEARSAGAGKGSTFAIRLPVAGPSAVEEDDAVAPVPAATVSRASLTGLPSLRGLRVLVVDDEADARELIGVILRGKGADAVAAGSAAEALEALSAGGFDVIVSDISMPDEDGYGLIGRVRALEGKAAQVPAVALTAYARDRDRDRALAAGFQLHLAKPVEPDDLVLAVANLAGRTEEQTEETKVT
jgi:signal transduction histidine kinase/ActR/RegA family two-component response regulator